MKCKNNLIFSFIIMHMNVYAFLLEGRSDLEIILLLISIFKQKFFYLISLYTIFIQRASNQKTIFFSVLMVCVLAHFLKLFENLKKKENNFDFCY